MGRGKHPLTIKINRDLLLHNLENIEPPREIVNRVVPALGEWGPVGVDATIRASLSPDDISVTELDAL